MLTITAIQRQAIFSTTLHPASLFCQLSVFIGNQPKMIDANFLEKNLVAMSQSEPSLPPALSAARARPLLGSFASFPGIISPGDIFKFERAW